MSDMVDEKFGTFRHNIKYTDLWDSITRVNYCNPYVKTYHIWTII